MKARIDVEGEAFEVELALDAEGRGRATVDGEAFDLRLERDDAGHHVHAGGRRFHVQPLRDGEARVDGAALRYRVLWAGRGAAAGPGASGPTRIRPPMPGRLEKLLVQPGDAVEAGQALFVLEAMKMHNEVRAPSAGRVKAVHAQPGDALDPSHVVLEVEPLAGARGQG